MEKSSNKPEERFSNVTSGEIEKALLNLRQLTFEVTDACNLCCKYCGYGELYQGYDRRESKYLSLTKAKLLIDYLINLWKIGNKNDYDPVTYISFYGGEPLVNMNFIQEKVE